jgi:hypothetical protein
MRKVMISGGKSDLGQKMLLGNCPGRFRCRQVVMYHRIIDELLNKC